MTRMMLEKARVLTHRRMARDHYLMRLKSPRAARHSRPGQFLHVRCADQGTFPLLRRPFSLFDVDMRRGTVDFIYKVVGRGTAALSEVSAGSSVDFLGPLGHPFEIPRGIRTAYLIGGGVGIPPLYLLAKSLLQKKVKVAAFLGARTKGWVICREDFRKLDVPVHTATDDGTLGYRGSVVDLLHTVIANPAKRSETISLFICGPTPMMAAAAELARERSIPAQVSLEERMGCAMGVCMGCVVEVATEPIHTHRRFQRVCTEGPVFDSEVVRWR